jgi:hypothetical protein
MADFKEARRKRRNTAWWVVSIVAHIALIGGILFSEGFRHFLFGDPNEVDTNQNARQSEIDQARNILTKLTKQRIQKENAIMVDLAKQVKAKNAERWGKVIERAEYNDAFQKVVDAPLPEVTIDEQIEDEAWAVKDYYAKAKELESQVLGLYENYRAINLTLLSASGRPVQESLSVSRIERPPRPDLRDSVIEATITNLNDGKWLAFKKEMTLASSMAAVMANNCKRITDMVTGQGLAMDAGEGVTAFDDRDGDGYEVWQEENVYLGDTLLPQDRFGTDLESVDPNAKVHLGQHVASADNANKAGEWMAFRKWYYIGPYAYASGTRTLESLDHAYPPEIEVDLDAVDIGKGGKTLRWKYKPMTQVRMEPYGDDFAAQSLWYFYTEFHSDAERTAWLNFASDDYGVAFLNGEKIYSSGTERRPWVILDQRHFAEVELRKGVNRLLFKLDNAKGTTGFTALIHLGTLSDNPEDG